MEKRDLEVGDIVQINPENGRRWGGFLVVVTEPERWGCQGYIIWHTDFNAVRIISSGKAFVRVKFEDIEYVGRMFWTHEDAEEEREEEEENEDGE
jgi:hypothetical protein